MFQLHYGDHLALNLELPTASVTDCAVPVGMTLADPTDAVRKAVESPLEFPPLLAAVVPGDNVVVALEGAVPRAAAVAAGIVGSLLENDLELGSIGLLVAEGHQAALDDFPAELRSQVEIQEHDSRDRSRLSYLAASREGKPIYFNQSLCDADVVIPVGVSRLPQSLDYFGVHAGLFPTFSDEVTQQRFRAPSTHDWAAQQRRRREEVAESAWLLGVQLIVQVVPGAGDTVLQIFAGEGQAVTSAGQAFCESAWLHQIPQRSELVLASIEGPAANWDDFARALYSASQAVTDQGAIVLCTDLAVPLGPALGRLREASADSEALQEIRRDRSPDATAAAVLAETKQRARIYLLSQLSRDEVEDLGIGYVANVADIERLGRQAETCLLLGNAQFAVAVEACAAGSAPTNPR